MKSQEVLPNLDYSPYTGQWVIICDNKIVAHNKDLSKISKDIDKCPKTPTVAKIPAKGTLIF